MDWDGIAQMVGEYDKYQMLMVWLVFVPAHLSFGPHYYEQLFMSITPYYWCDPSASNLSSAPKDTSKVTTEQTPVSPGSRGQCWVTYSNISNSEEVNNLDPNRSRMRTSDHVTLACTNGYVYDRSWLHSDESIVTAWDLVCDRSWFVPLTMTLFLVGCLFGQCLCLFVAHRYGRRKPFFIFLGAQCVVGVVTAFAPDFSSFTILRFFMGTTVPGVLSSPSALAREIVGSPYRVKIWFVSTAARSLGVLLLAPIAVLIRDWTLLSLTTSLPFVAFFFYWWVLPESPPWLITRGRFQETGRLLCNISQTNGKNISPDFIVSLKRKFRIETALQDGSTKKAEPTLLNLFYTPNLCRKTLLIMSIWLLNSTSFVGLTYYAFEIDEHVNLNYFLACCAEFLGVILPLCFLHQSSRRCSVVASSTISGVLLLALLSPSLGSKSSKTLFFLSKLTVSTCHTMLPVWTVEQMPIVLKESALGLGEITGQLGLLLLPTIMYFGRSTRSIPLIFLGTAQILVGLSALGLPETLHQKPLSSCEEAEEFGKYCTLKDIFRIGPPRMKQKNGILKNRGPQPQSPILSLLRRQEVLRRNSDCDIELNTDQQSCPEPPTETVIVTVL